MDCEDTIFCFICNKMYICGMKNESVITFLAGAAIGAVLGVLFAPAKGDETREKVRETSQDSMEALKNAIVDKLDKVEKILDTKEENYE